MLVTLSYNNFTLLVQIFQTNISRITKFQYGLVELVMSWENCQKEYPKTVFSQQTRKFSFTVHQLACFRSCFMRMKLRLANHSWLATLSFIRRLNVFHLHCPGCSLAGLQIRWEVLDMAKINNPRILDIRSTDTRRGYPCQI